MATIVQYWVYVKPPMAHPIYGVRAIASGASANAPQARGRSDRKGGHVPGGVTRDGESGEFHRRDSVTIPPSSYGNTSVYGRKRGVANSPNSRNSPKHAD